mgnify:CR=1 FL=1|jgi:hypothetical protein
MRCYHLINLTLIMIKCLTVDSIANLFVIRFIQLSQIGPVF